MNSVDGAYSIAREVFSLFRERISADRELASEFQMAIVTLRSSYNTAIYENRFVVGGAIEHLVVAAFNGAKMPAAHVGRGDTRIDVRVQAKNNDAGFSTKASFSTLSARLINTLGSSEPIWREPTLFLFDKYGIVYADPELLPNATKREDGALVLDGKLMRAYITTYPEYLIPMEFQSPRKGNIASSRTASEDVARMIIKNFPRLLLP